MLKTSLLAIGATVAAGWAYLRHIQLPQGPSRLSWDRQVFGHRGCRNVPGIPENTIEAFQYALSNGASGVELDVKLTKDKEAVVFHDGFVQPLLRGTSQGPIGSFSLEELRSMPYRDDPTGQIKIPTLEEAVLFCKDNYLQLLIEIKERKDPKAMVQKILDLYRRHGESYMYAQTTVISFSPFILYAIRRADPRIAVCQLHSGDLIHAWKTGGIEPLSFLVRWGPTFLLDAAVHFMQVRIAPWVIGASMVGPKYTLFSESVRRKWMSRGILTYLWGFRDDRPAIDEFLPEMRRQGVFIAVDSKYASYAALAQQAKDEDREAARLRREMEEAGYYKR